MIFLYDNLTATVIGAFVLLIVLFSMQRLTTVQIERTATYMVKAHANEFSTWMEEDLLKMHEISSEEEYPVPFLNPWNNDDGLTTRFIFRKDSTDFTVNPPQEREIRIRYTLNQVGTRTIGDEEMPVYQLVREHCNMADGPCAHDSSSHWYMDGGSTDLLSYFRVDMLDRDANPVENPADAEETSPGIIRNTRVRFAMVTPFDTERTTLREVYYGATLILER